MDMVDHLLHMCRGVFQKRTHLFRGKFGITVREQRGQNLLGKRAVLIHRRNRLQVTFHFPLTAVGRMAYDYCLRLRFSSGPVLCQLFRFVQNQCHGIKVQTVLAVRLFYFLCLPAKPVLDQNRKVLLQGFNLVGLTFILLRDLPVLLHNRI